MTQDCLDSPSTASAGKCLPKGIHVIGADKSSAPRVEGISSSEHEPSSAKASKNRQPSTDSTSWSYLFLQHMAARTLLKWLETYNAKYGKQPYFIHQTYRYSYKNQEEKRGLKKELTPTVSGLVFLQGTVRNIQAFLKTYFPQYHLVNNCCTGRPASIRNSIMQPFMNVMKAHPENVTFLRDSFEQFAKDHVKLRVLTGPFKGYEGYIVRIDRDRQLVFDFGGYAVAIRGVHKEDFQEVE